MLPPLARRGSSATTSCRDGVVIALLALSLAACGVTQSGPPTTEAAPAPAPESDPTPDPEMPGPGGPDAVSVGLPPAELDGLTVAFADDLDSTGTRLTRASLIDREGGSTDPDPDGTHLALYLEPPEGSTPEDYLEGMVTLTRRFAAAAFERYPGLTSFDVCQVPFGDVQVTGSTPFTLVDVTREGFDAWLAAGGDLPSLLALGMSPESGVRITMTRPVKELPEVVAVLGGGSVAG